MFNFLKPKPAKTPTAKPAINKGLAIEQSVKTALQAEGLTLISENYHSRFGEIDLIFVETTHNNINSSKSLVFIEVRYRANARHGSGAESVSKPKQSKIIKTAQLFLQKEAEYAHFNCRFDVISVCQTKELNQAPADQVNKGDWQALDKNLSYQWLKDAFQASAW